MPLYAELGSTMLAFLMEIPGARSESWYYKHNKFSKKDAHIYSSENMQKKKLPAQQTSF